MLFELNKGALKRQPRNQRGFSFEARPITTDFVKQALTSKPQKGDQLHRWIRSLYFKRTRSSRRKQPITQFFWKYIHTSIINNLKSVLIK